MQEYGDLHRATLQTLMNHGAIECKEFESIFIKICRQYESEKSCEEVINAINTKISQLDQRIAKHNYGLTNTEFYIFHSTSETSMSKFQNSYKEADLEFFKALFLTVASNENVRISPRESLNLTTQIVGAISKVRAQKLIENWIEGAYFYQNQDDDQIYIGPKLLIEFKELLQSMELNHVKSCLLCESIAIWGDRCSNCSTIYHSTCIRRFINRTNKCPSCKETWQINENN